MTAVIAGASGSASVTAGGGPTRSDAGEFGFSPFPFDASASPHSNPLYEGACTPDLIGPGPDGWGRIEEYCWAWCALASLVGKAGEDAGGVECTFDPKLRANGLTPDAEVGSIDAPICPDQKYIVGYLESIMVDPYCGPIQSPSDAGPDASVPLGVTDQCCYLFWVREGV
jgi:hypothetical protein